MPSSYPDLTTSIRRLPGVLAIAAFSGTALLPASAGAEVIAELAPVGILAAELTPGISGLAFPLIAESLFTGPIAANDAESITLAGNAQSIRSALAGEGRYYLEVLSGPLEGERFDVSADLTIDAPENKVVLDLGASSMSTSHTLVPDTLRDARCALRPHVVLASLPEMFTPVLSGSNQPNGGDAVQILTSSGFVTYYLRADGHTWRRAGSAADMGHVVIPPDSSILIRLHSEAKAWSQVGQVRTNAMRKNLSADVQSFATGYPVPVSPAELGALVDTDLPEDVRWSGSNNAHQADSVLLYSADDGTFRTHYLRGDGVSWFQLGGSATDLSDDPLIPATGLTLIQRKHADSGYVILPPFDL